MKYLFIIFFSVLTFKANGFSERLLNNRAWNDIASDTTLFIEWLKLDLGVGVFVNNICKTQDSFRTINPVQVCLNYKAVYKEVCVESEGTKCRGVDLNYQAQYGETSRVHEVCASYETKNLLISRTQSIYDCNVEMVYPKTEQFQPAYCPGELITKQIYLNDTFSVGISDAFKKRNYLTNIVLGFKEFTLPDCK